MKNMLYKILIVAFTGAVVFDLFSLVVAMFSTSEKFVSLAWLIVMPSSLVDGFLNLGYLPNMYVVNGLVGSVSSLTVFSCWLLITKK